MVTEVTVLTAARLIDGTGAAPVEGAAVVVEDGRIARVGKQGDALPEGERVRRIDLGDRTLLPGLINCHVHICLPGDGTALEDWMQLPDELLLLQAATNARASLYAGVTTLRECGGKGGLTFRLRDAIRAGIIEGPTFVLSGRPLTITGGHCHFFGGEADGPDEMRRAARRLLKEGADFIKIMAAGGGTRGTYPQFPAYTTEELKAAIDEAHNAGKRSSCHCLATESIFRALDAGTDGIEHAHCYSPDRSVEYNPRAGERIAAQGVYVTPTLQVGEDGYRAIRNRPNPTSADRAYLEQAPERNAKQIDVIRRYRELGVKLVAGNDAGWRFTRFDTFAGELVEMAKTGMPPLETIHAATGRAAELIQLDHERGTLRSGLAADLIAVDGDPARDLTALYAPTFVMQAGRLVVDRANGARTPVGVG